MFLTVLSLNFVGDTLQRSLDVGARTARPRMSRRVIHPGPSARAPLLEVDDLRTAFETPAAPWWQGSTASRWGWRPGTRSASWASPARARPCWPTRSHSSSRPATPTSAAACGSPSKLVGLSAKAMRSVWGVEAAIVFQDPMTSLNATMRIGDQITESLRYHLDMSHSEARTMAVALLRSVSIPSPSRLRAYPHQLSGGMRSGSRSPSPWPAGPTCWWPTSPPRSTSPSRSRSSTCSRPRSGSGRWA